jgi:hypothetical protein
MYSKGVCWVGDCRIPYVDDKDMTLPDYANKVQQDKPKHTSGAMTGGINKMLVCNTQGRFTPNLLVCDDMLNDGSVNKSRDRKKPSNTITKPNINFGGGIKDNNEYSDKGTNSRYYDLDLWFDKMLEKL